VRLNIYILVLLFSNNLYCQVTTYADIKPIIDSKCLPCHQSQEIAPFSLRTYNDIKRNASTILYVINKKIMPPWLPDTSYRHFKNERRLTVDEILTIKSWVQQDCIDSKNSSSAPAVFEKKPLKPDTSFFIKNEVILPEDDEKYVSFTFKLFEKQGRHVKRINFYTKLNAQNVHHCNIFVYSKDSYSEEDAVYVAGWTRGNPMPEFPSDLGFKIDSFVTIVVELHCSKVPVKTTINAQLNIYFDDNKATRFVKILDCGGPKKFKEDTYIPSNQITTYHITDTIKDKISVFSLFPHMHIFGKKLIAYAVLNNDTIPLLKIDKWDFDWQEQYILSKPLVLEKGTQVHLFYTYDNTKANLLNPYIPPKPILFSGMKSTDEMLNLFLHYTDYKEGDEVAENW
jgi:hypothetical protein